MASFAHLHVHSEYSLLDGFSNIKKLIKRAQDLGMTSVGLTDHGTMFGAIDFYNAATSAGIKPIIGVEAYMSARGMSERDPQYDKKSSHLLLLAENDTGYKNLLQIASAAQLNGFYYYPRIDHDFLAAHSEGLICTSGCMSAEVPRLIQQGNMDAARRQLDWYYETFGKDHFFLELQEHNIPELTNINKMLIDLGRRYDARFVATNDVHYINKEDARLQDIMLAIQTGCLLSDPNRMRMTDNSYYLRTPDEMETLFAGVPDALSNTLLIAERCNVDLSFKGYRLPIFPVPEGYTAETYLRQLCETGLIRRYGERATSAEVRQRLDYELGVIHKMGFDTYFLIVWDLCRHAREVGIWYNARGSAAGSMVAYTLDITIVDPLSHGLIFERFLNPGRISMPDIDMDFPDDRRAEMLSYTAHKYGDDKVAQIITFGTLGARAALRDVGRVMDIPLSEVDRVTKLVPNVPGKAVTITQALEEVAEFKQVYETEPNLRDLIDTAAQMEGVVRNAGTHAAGVIITDKPIVEYIPLHRPTSGSAEDNPIKTVTQFEMSVVDALGLLKVDFLGLATLTIMARACDLIKRRTGKDFNLDNIPVDDPATYEMMGRGETAGVFQVEGAGMRRWLVQMKPKELANVIAMVALFRPGPMDFIPGYIRRMHGEEQVEYRHPLLEPIFKETYGYPVYQEQLMFAAVQLAGYTPSESDDLRKAIAKKIKDKLLKHREKFIHGSQERGISEETATAIFDDWEEFARYGFNKCLPGDTEILDAASGRLLRIADLFSGQAQLSETLTCDTDELRLQPGRVAQVMENGVKRVYCLTTALGRQIEATSNHPFYTFDGWRMLGDLQPGDLIAAPRRIPVQGSQIWPDYEVIALGHLLAEGNLCHPSSVYFYNQDPMQIEDYCAAAEQFDNLRCRSALHKGTYSVYAARIDRQSPPGIVPWAQRLGIWGQNAHQKTIPTPVFELNNRQVGLLISRMWQGDGHVDLASRCLFYATASERLARQMQHLLLRLGVISRLRQVEFPYKEGRLGYQLFVTGHENLRAFMDAVGVHFLPGQRRSDLLQMLELTPAFAAGTKDVVPLAVKELVRAAKQRQRVTWEQMNAGCGVAQREFYPTGAAAKRGFKRATISRLADYFDDAGLRRLAQNDIYWDEITSIEYVGEKQTYDLEVPGLHNFVANDLLVHNSHAADYGIIAVQTGYLKVHHPVEYMTALLAVSQNDSAKVALYVADARRMGIAVAPPNINASDWDFTIEDLEGGKATIRFGLGAVKNVGQGSVEAIIKARQEGGPFKSVNDFIRRADLRQVGKRALECLIRVGAMDHLGPRPSLLAALDRMMAVSQSHFRAADAGQLSLFGGDSGITEEIVLPKPTEEFTRREMLNWERELIGVYVSDHPLSPVMDVLSQAVSHFSGQLAEANSGDKVRVAGLVTRVRPHQTKSGKAMGFVTMEDVQGNIELVVFPRTWEQFKNLLELERVVVVDGSIDAGGSDPKILVDNVTTELKTYEAYQTPLPEAPPAPPSRVQNQPVRSPVVTTLPTHSQSRPSQPPVAKPPPAKALPGQGKPAPTPAAAAPVAVPPPAAPKLQPQVAEKPLEYGRPASGAPPPPEEFPEGLNFHEMVPDGFVIESEHSLPGAPLNGKGPQAQPRVELQPAAAELPAAVLAVSPHEAMPHEIMPPELRPLEAKPIVAGPPAAGADDEEMLPESSPLPPAIPLAAAPPAAVESPRPVFPYLIAPSTLPDGEGVYMITIVLRQTGDKIRDQVRMRNLHGVLISYPGHDRFAFLVYEAGRGYQIEFPNLTTGYGPELLARLQKLVGAENVQVDALKFH